MHQHLNTLLARLLNDMTIKTNLNHNITSAAYKDLGVFQKDPKLNLSLSWT